MGAKKTSESDPLMTCRKAGIDDIETGSDETARDEAWRKPADWPGGVRHGGGVSLVRASVRNVGTCRPAPAGDQWRQHGPAAAGGRESPKRLIREGLSTDAGHRGGPDRSSDEGPVMGLERRGRVILACSMDNREVAG